MSLDISPGQFVTAPDGTKIWAAACGNPSKPAVVFVHGFACTSDVFEKQYTDAMMLENLYIIRYDLRGCGRSEGPLNAEAYSSERQAGDFKAVIDAYGVHKPFAATWSMGGIVPPDVVAKYGPDSLAGQILIGSFPHHNMHSEIIHPHIVSLIPGLITEDIALFAKTLPDFVLACFAPEYELPYDVYAKWIGGTAPRPPIVRQSMLMRKQDETAIMAAAVNQFPYLVIHGGEDQHLFAWKLEKWLKDHQFSQYEFHLLPGVGHSPFYEAPDVTNKLILKFVQEHYHDSDSTCST
ncbi:alpha/beta-hydrolase [Gymnopus androsaceus JB14]|uniref:Alpha/beta-hydrolase n=1 Tax=Gymnopus androsaceus JB14 TaxID=1447944 RepID=A0A6A4HVZ0_9AGAR|nr:alpha/beta-hydrolase [Gymnopus androsaceus JB14]